MGERNCAEPSCRALEFRETGYCHHHQELARYGSLAKNDAPPQGCNFHWHYGKPRLICTCIIDHRSHNYVVGKPRLGMLWRNPTVGRVGIGRA